MFLKIEKDVFKDLLDTTRDLEFSIVVEGWDHSYRTPLIYFEKGIIKLLIIVNNKKDKQFARYTSSYYELLEATLNSKTRRGNKESFGIQKMINLDQAVKIIESQEYINVIFTYNQETYQKYYSKNHFNLLQDIKDFVEKIKTDFLRKI